MAVLLSVIGDKPKLTEIPNYSKSVTQDVIPSYLRC